MRVGIIGDCNNIDDENTSSGIQPPTRHATSAVKSLPTVITTYHFPRDHCGFLGLA